MAKEKLPENPPDPQRTPAGRWRDGREALAEAASRRRNSLAVPQAKVDGKHYGPEAIRREIDKKAERIHAWAQSQGLKEGRHYKIIKDVRQVEDDPFIAPHERKEFFVIVDPDFYEDFRQFILGEYRAWWGKQHPGSDVCLHYSWGGRFLVDDGGVPFDTVAGDASKGVVPTHHAAFKKFFREEYGSAFPSADDLQHLLERMSKEGLSLYEEALRRLEAKRTDGTLPHDGYGLIDGITHAIMILNDAKNPDIIAVRELPETIRGNMTSSMRHYADLTYNAKFLVNLDRVMEITGIKIPDNLRIDRIMDRRGFPGFRSEEACRAFAQRQPGKRRGGFARRVKHAFASSLRGFQTPMGIDFLASFILLVLALVLYTRLMPTVSKVQYERGPEPPQVADFPLFMDSNGSSMTVKFHLKISPLHPKIYHIVADDCIEQFLVDGHPIPQAVFGECIPNEGKELMLNEYFPSGDHTVEVSIGDNEGGSQGFDLNASYYDSLVLTLQAVIFVLICLSSFLFWRMLKLRRWWLFAILLAGLVLRLTYFYATPYNARVNDVDGHVEYVQWILDHHSIPSSDDGWEFFQPPFYYAVSAVFGGIGKAVIHTRAALLWMLQFEGLLISVAMLFLSVWIGSFLFPTEKRAEPHRAGRRWFALFISLVATSPILIASAAKINNDVLIQLLSFLAVGFLVRFWQTGHRFHWYALTVVIILGILTKLNMVFFVPVAYLCLLFTRRLTFEQKLVLGGVTLLALLSFTEWFYVLKYVGERATFPVGNVQGLTGDLAVRNTLSNFIQFHPLRFIRIPFISPFDDATGRQFFWEYFLKSALFGEYWFGEKPVVVLLARILNALTLFVLVPLGVYGILRAIIVREERRFTFPLLCTFFLIVAGHLLFRYKAPFSCSQDFRYSIAALVPFFYFILSAVRSFPRLLRFVSFLALWAFVVLGATFIVFIPVFHL